MTATEGGPALRAAPAAATVGDDGQSRIARRPGTSRLRTVLALAWVEASLLARSLLTLAGLLAGGAVIWLTIRSAEPLWWNVGWRIGLGQVVLGMTVLVAAQLAAGRARRNGVTDLYASFPATAGTRTLGHLAGLLGAVPASLLLIGAVAAVVQSRDAIGTPSVAVLAGGLLLVIAAGAAGIAIGTRFSHPLAGTMGALVLFLSSGQSHLPWAAGLWLYPWASFGDQLGSLPGPLAGYPPAGAHTLELAGLAALAGVVALATTATRAQARSLLAAGIIALAAVCLAGLLQLRPIPTAGLNHLVTEVTDPASAQRCTTASQARYCLYPGFSSLLPSLEAPVDAVLAHVPARPAQPLTFRQVAGLSLPDSTLTHGHQNRQVSEWDARVQRAPANHLGNFEAASAAYLPVGSWPAAGGPLADAHFDLALAAAEWAVRIPSQATAILPQADGSPVSRPVTCAPLDQAREAIAIWLAMLATHTSAGAPHAGLGGPLDYVAVKVGNSLVPTWIWPYPGSNGGYVVPPGGGPKTTLAGYLLASAMTRLPEQKIDHVLTNEWARWLNWHTTDAQLAAALGIPTPRVPAVRTPPTPGTDQPAVALLCTTGAR
jgi:hypothetical protein